MIEKTLQELPNIKVKTNDENETLYGIIMRKILKILLWWKEWIKSKKKESKKLYSHLDI